MATNYSAVQRTASGIDKLKNGIAVLIDPASSPLSVIQAKNNIASGLVNIGQGIDDFKNTLPPGAAGLFGNLLNQFSFGLQLGQLGTAIQNGSRDEVISASLGMAAATCGVLSIIPPTALLFRASSLSLYAAKELFDARADIGALQADALIACVL